GGGVSHDTQQGQHREQRVHHGQQLVSQLREVEAEPEHIGHGLNQQQQRRDKRQPEVLVLNAHFPVDVHTALPPLFILYSITHTCSRVQGLSGFSPSD